MRLYCTDSVQEKLKEYLLTSLNKLIEFLPCDDQPTNRKANEMSETHTIEVDDTRYPPGDNRRVGGLTVSATVIVDNKGLAWAKLVDARNAQELDSDGLPRMCDLDYGLRLLEEQLSSCDFYNFYTI